MNSRFYKRATVCQSGFTPTTAMAHHGGSVRIPSLEPERTRSDMRIKTEAHHTATATFSFSRRAVLAASIPLLLAFRYLLAKFPPGGPGPEREYSPLAWQLRSARSPGRNNPPTPTQLLSNWSWMDLPIIFATRIRF